MDVTGSFFDKLRALAVTLEKQAEQLKQTFHGGNTGKKKSYRQLLSLMRYISRAIYLRG